MLKAIVSHGAIHPLEPLPSDWQEGQPLRIEKAEEEEMTVEEIDRDFAILAGLCENSDPEDEERLRRALEESRQQAKEQVKRQMGLSLSIPSSTVTDSQVACRLPGFTARS